MSGLQDTKAAHRKHQLELEETKTTNRLRYQELETINCHKRQKLELKREIRDEAELRMKHDPTET